MSRDTFPVHQAGALEARLAARVTAALNERTVEFPHDLGERLRVGRDQALVKARESRTQAAAAAVAPTVVVDRAGNASLTGGPASWWMRLASIAPLLVLFLGLLLVQRWSDREQVLAAADIDAVLLSDDLPPAAYSDPGFREFLKSPPP